MSATESEPEDPAPLPPEEPQTEEAVRVTPPVSNDTVPEE